MDNKVTNKHFSSKLVLTVWLSCGLTITSAIVYIVLCSLAIYYRNNCNAGISSSSDSSQFTQLFVGLYFKQENCAHALLLDDVTREQTVFVSAVITLTFAILSLIAAIVSVTVINVEKAAQFVESAIYSYIAIYILSLAVDVYIATNFGMDSAKISTLKIESAPNTSDTYTKELLRLGALLLMTISLKGFVYHVLNMIFAVLLSVFLTEYRTNMNSTVHAIHKLGALHSFEQRPNEDTWQQQSESSYQFRGQQRGNDDTWQQPSENMFPPYKGSQVNPVFVHDEENRSQNRDTPRTDYLNPAFDRSYSWNHGSTNSARPFSYLEESKPQSPTKPPNSPSHSSSQWQREREQWQPNVPAPDYSPETPRRLKSALKSSYM
ncbi:uncharacterized protein ACR2FA_002723 [Aphomia sociella]